MAGVVNQTAQANLDTCQNTSNQCNQWRSYTGQQSSYCLNIVFALFSNGESIHENAEIALHSHCLMLNAATVRGLDLNITQ